MYDQINHVRTQSVRWSKEVFGNIFKKKRDLMNRIGGIQRAQSVRFKRRLQKLETKLLKQYHETLIQEERMWKEKSRIKWLQAGDKNTHFFHLASTQRQHRRVILTLRDDVGEWVDEPDALKRLAVDYYKRLYNTDEPIMTYVPTHGFPRLTARHISSLLLEVTNMEVKKVINEMQPLKSPGPDGLQPIFFQKCWNTIGAAVSKLVNDALRTGTLDNRLNESFITLIPKEKDPTHISQFRPISLTNVILKIVTKTMAYSKYDARSNPSDPESFYQGKTNDR